MNNKEKFLNALEEYDNDKLVITVHDGDEISCRFKISISTIDEYDDEIIIRGDDNDFVILSGEPKNIIEDEIDEEFLFRNGNQILEVEFI